MVKKIVLVIILGIFLKGFLLAESASHSTVGGALAKPAKEGNQLNRGVWVSVFSDKLALNSKEGVLGLIETCKKMRINQIYLQLYQSGRAYYDSKIADNSKYKEIIKAGPII